MIDYFALALTHSLILLALIRIAGKAVLDREPELDINRKRRRKHREEQRASHSENEQSGAPDA